MTFLNDLLSLPQWAEYTLAGIIIVYMMYLVGKILARSGHSPAWSLLLLIPFVQIIAIWYYAFKKWPLDDLTSVRKEET